MEDHLDPIWTDAINEIPMDDFDDETEVIDCNASNKILLSIWDLQLSELFSVKTVQNYFSDWQDRNSMLNWDNETSMYKEFILDIISDEVIKTRTHFTEYALDDYIETLLKVHAYESDLYKSDLLESFGARHTDFYALICVQSAIHNKVYTSNQKINLGHTLNTLYNKNNILPNTKLVHTIRALLQFAFTKLDGNDSST